MPWVGWSLVCYVPLQRLPVLLDEGRAVRTAEQLLPRTCHVLQEGVVCQHAHLNVCCTPADYHICSHQLLAFTR